MPVAAVDLFDRLPEALAGRQAAVGLHGEGDHHRHAGSLGRTGDADRFLRIGHCNGGDHVGFGLLERADLEGMVGLGLGFGHDLFRVIAVAARADAAADHHLGVRGFVFAAQVMQEVHRAPVHLCQRVARIAELGAPVRACPPRCAFQDEADPVGLGDGDVVAVVAVHRRTSGVLLEQIERGEIGQVEPVMEDQACFQTAVGEEKVA